MKLRKLLALAGSPEALYGADENALQRLGLSPTLRKTLLDKELEPAQGILEACRQAAIKLLPLTAEAYPSGLRQTPDAPILLYCRGTLPPAGQQPWIGLVGAREADRRGLTLARRFGAEIAACGGLVVTGMARGIDAEAATGALEQESPVVGVLGCGADVIYPKENARLFARVAERGCLVSEYPPGVRPDARHFPARNRIISALSDGVVVVQAAEGSGALITARWAAEQGRDLFSVPGPAGEPLSRGCNQLLREGAILTESGLDVMREYLFRYPETVRIQEAKRNAQGQGSGIRYRGSGDESGAQGVPRDKAEGAVMSRPQPAADPENAAEAHIAHLSMEGLTPVQTAIVTALQDGPLQLDALIARTGLPAAQVLPQLTVLQIKEIISQKPGKIYELS